MKSEKKLGRGMNLQHIALPVSVGILLAYFYVQYYPVFVNWKLSGNITDWIVKHFGNIYLFRSPFAAKWISISSLAVYAFSKKNKKVAELDRPLFWTILPIAFLIVVNICLYFLADLLLPINSADIGEAGADILMTALGVWRLSIWLKALVKIIIPHIGYAPTGPHIGGLRQETRLITNKFSINLRASHIWNGQAKWSYINFINPRRTILIIGSPGSGKSRLVIEPTIRQLIEKGFAMFIYDFKFSTLTSYAYTHYRINRNKYPKSVEFICINFSDLSRTHRCNIIQPKIMNSVNEAIGASKTILFGMNKNWAEKSGDFFVESPINFVAALIWYLRRYMDGKFCTLAHVIELSQVPYDELFSILNAEQQVETLIAPFIQAFKNNSTEMLDGQIASAVVPLGRLSSPDLYYILTGNDVSLDINNPDALKIFCLGGDPARQEELAPIISLYIDRMSQMLNKQKKHPCALVCDEFATFRAASMLNTIATARSNDIIPILSIQDISQLRTRYSRNEADQIFNAAGIIISGQVGGETAQMLSMRFPQITQYRTSYSRNGRDTSVTESEHLTAAVPPSTIAALSSGEFVGIIADNPDQSIELKAFHATIWKDKRDLTDEIQPLPQFNFVTPDEINQNYLQVKQDITQLVSTEIQRMLSDPTLKQKIVKR